MIRLLADENIPYLNYFFEDIATITTLPGRLINANDCLNNDALITRSVTPVNSQLLANSPIQFVGSCTIGTDHINSQDLDNLNIRWSNAPGCNAESVCHYVLSTLANYRPDWLTRRVGIIGCGRVGGTLLTRLRSAGIDCIGYDPFLPPRDGLMPLEDVLSCDVISCHTPLTYQGLHPTYRLLDQSRLDQIKPGALLISAGRGGVIDERSLIEVLKHKPINLALDVWENEPHINCDLIDKALIATPHIAGYSVDGKINGTYQVYKALCQYFELTASKALPQLNASELIKPCSINEAILQAYSTEADADLFKQTIKTMGRVELAFDHIRKHYPPRRDITAYNFSGSTYDNALAASLGFQVNK